MTPNSRSLIVMLDLSPLKEYRNNTRIKYKSYAAMGQRGKLSIWWKGLRTSKKGTKQLTDLQSSSNCPKSREGLGPAGPDEGPSTSSGIRAPQTIEANAITEPPSPLPQRDSPIHDLDNKGDEENEQAGAFEPTLPPGFDMGISDPHEDGTAGELRKLQLFPEGATRGLRVVHRPPESNLWIIFLHGLTGDSFRTWYHPGGTFWPKDLLPRSLPRATILTFGYDADVAKFLGGVGQGTLHTHALTFVSDVGTKLSMEGVGDNVNIFIVAHSLGGIVAKKAICISREAYDASHQGLHHRVAGFFFLGTPHQGSGQADLASVMLRIVDAVTLGWKRSNKKIVKVLQPSSEILEDLQYSFSQWIKRSNRISVRCFFEERAMAQGIVVPWASAQIDGYPCLPIPQNHSKMPKFSSIVDDGYQRLSGQLELCWRELNRTGSPQFIPASTNANYNFQTDEMERIHEEEILVQGYASVLKFPGMSSRLERIRKPTKTTSEQCPDHLKGLGWDFTQRPRQSDPQGTFDKGSWPVGLLMAKFDKALSLITQSRPVQIFVDALDECRANMDDADNETDEIRECVRDFHQVLEDLQDQPHGLAFCLSCRHYPSLAGLGTNTQIFAENENSDDIKKYLYGELTRGISRKDKAMVDPLVKSIADLANGSFQWVRLVTSRALRHYNEGDNLRKIQAKVRVLPRTLFKLYEEITLSLIDERGDWSLKLFQWLCFAERPLTVKELRVALAIIPESEYTTASELMTTDYYVDNVEQMKRLIPVISGGLAETKYEGKIQDDGSEKLFFIHQSVKDYLLSSGLKHFCPSLSSMQEVICASQKLLMASCVWLLTNGDYRQRESAEPLPVPLKAMPTYFWVFDGMEAHRKGFKSIWDPLDTDPATLFPFGKGNIRSLRYSEADLDRLYLLLIKYLGSIKKEMGRLMEPQLHASGQTYNVPNWRLENREVEQDGSFNLLKPQREDLNRVLRLRNWTIYMGRNFFKEPDYWGILPILDEDCLFDSFLDYASVNWQLHTQRSLENGPVELIQEPLGWFLSRSGPGWLKFLEHYGTLLHRAAAIGSHDIMAVLLEQDNRQRLNINARDDYLNTALGLAAKGGHPEVVSLLLDQESILIDLVDAEGDRPFYLPHLAVIT
ncbi:hypothetical protein PG991_010524 [Apiospora marii]|uniref:DUF676 domain-containing protein n=1 Tax=Apiospora marii TaxID=335849 RepID=A0ABR1RBI8_9PEZI